MQLQRGQIVEVVIQNMAFGGDGVAKYQGFTIFVEKGIPGDHLEISLEKISPNFAHAKIIKIITPSNNRIEPKCRYFGICGGCQFQHLDYKKQLEFKQQQVVDSFERIGKIKSPPVLDIIGCEDSYYYRNKMEFSFGYDENMKFTLGMHVPGRRYDIMDLEECFLQSELSVKIVNAIRELVKELGWLPYRYMTNEGFLLSLYVRQAKRTNEVMVNLVTGENLPKNCEGFKKLVEVLVDLQRGNSQKEENLGWSKNLTEVPKIASIYWSKTISKRGSPKYFEETLLYGKKAITEKMILENGDELAFKILPQAFFQVNTRQAEILYSKVLEFTLEKPSELIFDLFCGTGTIGLFLARHAEKVLGVELNESAIKSAMENAKQNNIFNVDFFVGDVSKVLKTVKEKPSLIVVDPPRVGLTEKLIEKINNFGAQRIVYVSCNPATLARDCGWLLEYGYVVKKIQPVDMFPQTYHIENVCLLER